MFIIGTVFGSFFLVIGTRLPLKENVITGRSRCDNCKKELCWYELIPIVSYVIQMGKCRKCKKAISINHLVIEIITGLLFVFGYNYFAELSDLLIYLVSISVALIIFVSDFKYMIILDSTWIIGTLLVIIIKLVFTSLNSTLISLASGIGLFLVMYSVKLIGDKLFKKESLGGGDIKLCLFIGLIIGFRLGLISLVFASFLALPYAFANVYLNKKNELPYGPFLIAAAVIIYIFIDKFTNLLILFSLL